MDRKNLGPLGPDVDATVTEQKVDATVNKGLASSLPYSVEPTES